MQLIVVFVFLKFPGKPVALANYQTFLLILATVFIAAGGYIINNILDQEADAINDKKRNIIGKSLSESMAYNIYVGLNLVAVGIGYYLSNVVMRPVFMVFFILCAALLYAYSTYLKHYLVIKNIVVSLMLALSIIIIGVFEIVPATDVTNRKEMFTVFSILFDFSIMAFLINFIREIVKDCEDVKGDYNVGLKTIPVVLGVERTLKAVFFFSLIPLFLVLYYVYFYLFHLEYATAFIFLFIVGPMLFFLIKCWSAKSKKDISRLSLILKFIIFFGVLAIAAIGINMKYYVA